ncbi:MAG: hypothetical protein OXE43_13795 [Chloroflexi bacterium]|nr:hypothetical protein [Chloroflexota bacterium]
MTKYFSDDERGPTPQDRDEISDVAWGGILAEIRRCASLGAFGLNYPDMCPDGHYVVGTDYGTFQAAMLAEIPGLAHDPSGFSILGSMHPSGGELPSSYDILDLIQFCWTHIARPEPMESHSFFRHDHLAFNAEAGKTEFTEAMQRILQRNGLAFELLADGSIRRTVPSAFRGSLGQTDFATGDGELDRLLAAAQRRFLEARQDARQEALEALWDAWERLKTLDGGGDKKSRVALMLDAAAGSQSPRFRDALEREATELTGIGNSLRIRHSETTQEGLARPEHADYLFYRLFSLIHLVLTTRSAA